jgi:hypothetical protein
MSVDGIRVSAKHSLYQPSRVSPFSPRAASVRARFPIARSVFGCSSPSVRVLAASTRSLRTRVAEFPEIEGRRRHANQPQLLPRWRAAGLGRACRRGTVGLPGLPDGVTVKPRADRGAVLRHERRA